MDKDSRVVFLDKKITFKGGGIFCYDSIKDRIGNYRKDKVDRFKKKIVIYLERLLDSFDEIDLVINENLDNFIDKIYDRYDSLEKKDENLKTGEKISSLSDRLEPMMSLDDMKKFGIDKEEQITELKELKKELLMENYVSVNKENNSRRRGILYVWMSVLIIVLLMGILIVINIIQR